MKFCVIIPCYNHAGTVNKVISEIDGDLDVIVVDDGSVPPVALERAECRLLRLEKNSGKASALRAGFAEASKLGYTHAITMDADGQHPPQNLKDFIKEASANPLSIILGARDFDNSAIPRGRKFLNKFSNFWFYVETHKRVGDTQCGYRCYPLAALESVKVKFKGFVFEVELLVKASWAGITIRQVSIPAVYTAETLQKSHYKPFADTVKFSLMNTRLCFLRLFFSQNMLRKMSLKK